MREPNLKTAEWLKRPVLQFLVSPQMNKIDIAEYLRKLYGIPVSKVHTANYLGEEKASPKNPMKRCAQRQPLPARATSRLGLPAKPPATSRARPRTDALRLKTADYKKAYVYLSDEDGAQRPRYHEIEAQLTPEALASWPAKPGRSAQELREKARREKSRR